MLSSWKTTAIGIGIGGGNLLLEALSQMQATGQPINWRSVLVSVGLIALGVLAKDSDKTGGIR